MKLNKFLPIVALSGIATVAMPLVACANNSTNIFNLNDDSSLGVSLLVLHNKNKANLVKNHTYEANIDVTNYKSSIYSVWQFQIVNGIEDQDINHGQISKASVWVDDIQYSQVPKLSGIVEKTFAIQSGEGVCVLYGDASLTTEASKIKIEFELLDDISDCYLCFCSYQEQK